MDKVIEYSGVLRKSGMFGCIVACFSCEFRSKNLPAMENPDRLHDPIK
jgi:hypothetical protein